MSFFKRFKQQVRTDENLQRFGRGTKSTARGFPRGALDYVVEKAPIVQWLPRYSPKWILNDLVAGMTVGVLLIPQGLAYAKIANIPVEAGLMSSWLPALIYTIMGTSKDLSTGPTSILGLLTAAIVKEMKPEGYSPQVTASAVALMVGIYCLILGLFKLGFLLDYISEPVLSGFIGGAAVVIIMGQVPSLLGLTKFQSGVANTISGVVTQLPKANWKTCIIGFTGILIIQALQWIGQKWGKKSKIVWAVSIGRAAIVVVLFTGISYAVNKDHKKKPYFAISAVTSKGIGTPDMPDLPLLRKVAAKSIAPFVAASLEHIAIGKAFASKNNYLYDCSQELTYLGVTNFFNSWFGAMTVGGAMSRTAVNSDAGVRSPMNGLFTAGFVLLGIYKLSSALYWIPKATLAAIIITAVVPLFMGPTKEFYHYWRTSFSDFVACMICFWCTMFISAEMGIAYGVAFSIVWLLLKSAFVSAKTMTLPSDPPISTSNDSFSNGRSDDIVLYDIPVDTKVFQFEDSILFASAVRARDHIIDSVQVYHTGVAYSADGEGVERTWSVAQEKRISRLRKRACITSAPPPLRIVVLDCHKVSNIDTTGVHALKDMRKEIKKFAGKSCEIRWVNVDFQVRKRFERFGWVVRTEREMENEVMDGTDSAGGDAIVVFETLARAVNLRRENSAPSWDEKGNVETYEVV